MAIYFNTYLNPLQVNWIHDGTLEEFNSCEMSLEETFQLKVRWLPAHFKLPTYLNCEQHALAANPQACLKVFFSFSNTEKKTCKQL